jgi:hypothetical protein
LLRLICFSFKQGVGTTRADERFDIVISFQDQL